MLEILYQDNVLVAVDKPSGLLVHRSNLDRHETRFAVQLLRDQVGRRVFPAHRLDKGTSGVLLFALDAAIASQLGRQFDAGTVVKTYLAVVRGWPPESGRIDHPLTRQFDDHGRPRTDAATPALPAITDYRRLATVELPVAIDRYPSSRFALVQLTPRSGRQHQLRRHLKHIAHPIIGDATHGKGRYNRHFRDHLGCARLLLACTGMTLVHPVSGRPLTLRAPLNGDFRRLVERLGWGAALESPIP